MTARAPERSEIDPQFTWNAPSVFPSDADWQSEYQEVTLLLADLSRFHGRLGSSPEILAEWFGVQQELVRRESKLSVYAGMSHSVDMTNDQASSRYSQMMGLLSQFTAATAFAEPEILELTPEQLQTWLDQTPELRIYAHYLDSVNRRRSHVRSAEVEELLGQASSPFAAARQIHGIFSDADLKFSPAVDSAGQTAEITQGTISALQTSPDREVRRSSFIHYADGYLALSNGMAACLEAGVKQDVFRARARRYPSSLDASTQSGNIPTEVFHNLITTYRAHIPTWHRYWELRRRALGHTKLPVYDIKAPLSAISPTVTYQQAIDWICEGMKPLGEEYVRIMRQGVQTERWVDVYPNRGKRMGAFSSGAPGTHPFIMMSFNDDLLGLSTLAHELGHSMHSYYTWREQPTIYSRYGMFVAEVASNFNQALVRAYLLKEQTDPDFQIALIEEAMGNFHRYFFVMPTLARFELEIHERIERGEALTAKSLTALMADLFREGFGPSVEMDDERVGITWAQFHTHLYSNFYVYQYATGISGAHALAQGVLQEGKSKAERYLDFLKAGGSLYPLDALKLAGVDLSTPEPVEQTFGILAGYVDQLEALL